MYRDTQRTVFTEERAGNWSGDDHGINCEGHPVFTVDSNKQIDERLCGVAAQTLAEFANQAHRMALNTFHRTETLPLVTIDLHKSEVDTDRGHHLLALEITRPDGKKGRLHLTLFADESSGRMSAEISALPRYGEAVRRTVSVKFDDWDAPLKD